MTDKHRPSTRYLLAALAAAALLSATSCELLLDVLVSSSDGGGGIINEIKLYSPYKVDFDGASAKTVTLSGLNANTVYLVKSNVSSVTAAGNGTGYAASGYASNRSVESMLTVRAPVSSDLISGNFDGVIRYDYQPARDFNENPPAIKRDGGRSLVSIPGTSLFEYSQDDVGSFTRDFYVDNDFLITATLQAIGTHCYVWVPDAMFGVSGSNTDNKLTQTQIDTLKSKFDLIYPLETNVLGYEYGGNSDGGVDHDHHISILLYDIGGDYISTQTGGAFGYFWSKDFFTQEQLGSSPITNLSEMFYVDAHFTDKYPDIMYSTLIHEFQHMINFNRKNIQQGVSSAAWYNEMLSQVAEDMLNSQATLGIPLSASPVVSRMRDFNAGYDQVGVNEFFNVDAAGSPESQWKNLVSYANTYAFGAYLVRNYGGANLMKAMEENSATGESSISLALHTVDPFSFADTTSGFRNAYRRYAEAFVYSGDSIPFGSKTFDKAVSTTIGGTSYTFPAIDIWTIANDGYDPANEYMISGSTGPTVWDIASTADMPPYSISLLSSLAWQNITGGFSVTLNKPFDPDVELYLMIR